MNYDNIFEDGKFKDNKRVCFIITPIGGENSEIRRHIDGVIDSIIIPVMKNDYEIKVAHRLAITGSINKHIIELIYNSDLVIANLTQTNPNVMYELAFRHTLGKPTITIAESGTKLPFDISSERTIFYKNDIQGVKEAQEELRKYLSQIDYSNEKTTGPIHDYLDSVELSRLISSHTQSQSQNVSEALDLIVKRLESIENAIPNMKKEVLHELDGSNKAKRKFGFSFPDSDLGELKIDQTYAYLKNVVSELNLLSLYVKKDDCFSSEFSNGLSNCISMVEQCIDNIFYIKGSN